MAMNAPIQFTPLESHMLHAIATDREWSTVNEGDFAQYEQSESMYHRLQVVAQVSEDGLFSAQFFGGTIPQLNSDDVVGVTKYLMGDAFDLNTPRLFFSSSAPSDLDVRAHDGQ